MTQEKLLRSRQRIVEEFVFYLEVLSPRIQLPQILSRKHYKVWNACTLCIISE
jgi:hypothetical protein